MNIASIEVYSFEAFSNEQLNLKPLVFLSNKLIKPEV